MNDREPQILSDMLLSQPHRVGPCGNELAGIQSLVEIQQHRRKSAAGIQQRYGCQQMIGPLLSSHQ